MKAGDYGRILIEPSWLGRGWNLFWEAWVQCLNSSRPWIEFWT